MASVVLPAPFCPTIASDEPAGMVRSKCSSTGCAAAGRRSVTSRKRISRAGMPAAGRVPLRQRAGRRHRRFEPQDGGDRRGGAVERPVEAAEGDQRRRRSPPARRRRARPSSMRPALAAAASARTPARFAPATTISRLQTSGLSRSRVASYCSSCRRVRRSTKRSIVQSARPNSRSSLPAGDRPPGGRRSRRRAAPRAPRRCCDRARRRSRAAASAWRASAPREQERRPPRVREQHDARRRGRRPVSTRPPAMKSIEIDSGGPVMPRSKSRATVRSLVSAGSSRWPHARRRDAAAVSRS